MDLKKRARKFFFSRFFVLGLLFFVQACLMVWIVMRAQAMGHIVAEFFYVVSVIMALWVLSRDMHPTYKLAWIVPILILPLFGGMFYLLFGTHGFRKKRLIDKLSPYLQDKELMQQDPQVLKQLEAFDGDAALQASYIRNMAAYPVYSRTKTEYFSCGEDFFEQLKKDLHAAKRCIFLEFFIVEEGLMFDEIADILEQKAQEGLDVRLIYDDVGSAARVSSSFASQLNKRGIKCCVFNARGLKLSFLLNNRDHRKIVVIDGRISYTGGFNLADEYINAISPFGYWKDSAVRLEGDASWSFTIIFLQTWGFASQEASIDFAQFMPPLEEQALFESDGFVLPYADSSPISNVTLSKYAFLNAIQDAEKSIYISTPYLIIDSEMQTALCLSAEMGIDVRIITPAIPDKKAVFEVTRANYLELLKAGVKIYEYSPGFIHSKTMMVDKQLAVIGTTNFDYRSFFLHFECGAFLFGSSAIDQLSADFEKSFLISKEISLQEQLAISVPRRIMRRTLSAFAPLL